MTDQGLEFYLDEPRLKMTRGGQLIARALTQIFYFCLSAFVFIALFSDIARIRATGALLLLFLVDRFARRNEADRHLNELNKSDSFNLAPYINPAALRILEVSCQRSMITREYFALCFLDESLKSPDVREALIRLDVGSEEFAQKLDELLGQSSSQKNIRQAYEIISSQEFLSGAFLRARNSGRRDIGTGDVLMALLSPNDDYGARIFHAFGISPHDLDRAITFSEYSRKARGWKEMLFHRHINPANPFRASAKPVINRAWTSRPTPYLDSFSSDFSELISRGWGDRMAGHNAEYERLIEILTGGNPNALLVGDAGAGKTTLIRHLADQISRDKVPEALSDKRVIALEISALVAGAVPSELGKRLKRITEEIILAGNIILYIPDIHNLVHTSGEGYLSAADALMPIVRNRIFPVIGASYPREFKKIIEPRSDFVSMFNIVEVNEISEEDAEVVAMREAVEIERHIKVVISFAAINSAIRLAKKYLRPKLLPESSLELLRESVILAKQRDQKILRADTVALAVENQVHVPVRIPGKEETADLLHLESTIHRKFIDQEEAVKAASDALREYRSGLTRPGSPIASFLFVGPTGVGKTALSKIIAEIQFGSENAMARFDMSEYQAKKDLERLIGSSDGSVLGNLTEIVRQKPYILILLDEFEKSSPDILNLFLQVLDEGRLTDALGRTVDFTNTIIAATSNAQSQFIKTSLDEGKPISKVAEEIKKKMSESFRPELLNRFSKIIVFKNLGPEEILEIAKLELGAFARLLESQGISITFDDETVRQIAKLGYDPSFGARPLRGVIEEKLRAPLAKEILERNVGAGDVLRVSFSEGKLQFAENTIGAEKTAK